MKNWLKKTNNQILLFNITILTIPLVFINFSGNIIPLIITFGIWIVGISLSFLFRYMLNYNDKNKN